MFHRILVSAFFMLGSVAAHSATVAIDPPAQTVDLGDTVTIALSGADFSETIEGGGVNLHFDPQVLQLTTVTVDDATWEFFTTPGTVDNTQGTLTDLTFSSFAGNSGSFPIAQLTFHATGSGISPLTLTESALNPFASGGALLNPPVTFASASISVAAVPVPAAVWLLLSGLAPMFYTGRRKT